MRIALAADHAAYDLKEDLKRTMAGAGHDVNDLGTHDPSKPDDYPDFAEKVGVDAASLVQVLFALGEMVTATQSVNDETLRILGEEMNYNIEVVSPEDEDKDLLDSFNIEFGEDEGGEEALVARPPVVTVGLEGDAALAVGIGNCVVEDVLDRLAQPPRIADHKAGRGVDVAGQLLRFLGSAR